MQEYKVVYDWEYDGFIKKVNECLAQGWVFQGGVSVTQAEAVSIEKEILFAQALVKGKL